MKRPLVASLIAAGAFAVGGVALAGTMQFRANPVTEFEIPTPVNVVGTPEAELKLKLTPDGQEMRYDLKITSPITDVLMAHLHVERNADNTGPIVVWLYPSTPGPVLIPGETDGLLASGVLTPSSIVGPLGYTWDNFIHDLRAGHIYANVHTLANPAGEIRDQVRT
jgi:CHRD domain